MGEYFVIPSFSNELITNCTDKIGRSLLSFLFIVFIPFTNIPCLLIFLTNLFKIQFKNNKSDFKMSNSIAKQQKPLKWGILGCGRISNDFIYSMYRKSETPNVVHAVATSNSLERAQNFVQSMIIPNKQEIKTYGSYEELLADPECEIIYIGILNVTHCRWTLAALEKGKKPVLCEKPMGLSVAESELMAKTARQQGLFLMEAFWSRLFPVYRKLRSILDKNELGAVKTIGAHFGTIPANSRFRLDLSECPVLDIGIYCVQFAMFCLNDSQPSLIRAHAVKNEEGCDISGNIYLEFNGGKTKASLMWETESFCPNSAFVAFENGIVQIPDWFYCPTRIQIIKGKAFGESMDTEEYCFPLKDDPDLYLFPNGSGMRYEVDHVYECIKNGLKESPVMPLESSIHLSAVMEEIRHQIGVVFPAQDNSPTKCNI